MASTAVDRRTEEFEFDWRLAQVAAKSNLYPDVRQNAEAAMAKILLGRSLGLEATQSLIGIHMVEGKPMLAAVTLASFVRKHDVHDFRVLVGPTDKVCAIEFGPKPAPGKDTEGVWLPWPEAYGISEFTIEKAQRAGLVKERSNWAKWPENMNYSRAMSNGVKWFCPDATQGIPVYHEGEVESGRALDGAIDGTVVEEDAVSLSAVAEDIPVELRDRFYAAYGAAADLGSPPSLLAVQMSVKGQPTERVVEYIASIERTNMEARAAAQDEAVDAVIVPEDEGETPEPSDSPVESLRAQIAVLEARQVEIEENPGDFAETSLELDQITSDIERLEGLIVAAQQEGQGSLL